MSAAQHTKPQHLNEHHHVVCPRHLCRHHLLLRLNTIHTHTPLPPRAPLTSSSPAPVRPHSLLAFAFRLAPRALRHPQLSPPSTGPSTLRPGPVSRSLALLPHPILLPPPRAA
eukprot:3495999-Rhodomonas_salina.1